MDWFQTGAQWGISYGEDNLFSFIQLSLIYDLMSGPFAITALVVSYFGILHRFLDDGLVLFCFCPLFISDLWRASCNVHYSKINGFGQRAAIHTYV